MLDAALGGVLLAGVELFGGFPGVLLVAAEFGGVEECCADEADGGAGEDGEGDPKDGVFHGGGGVLGLVDDVDDGAGWDGGGDDGWEGEGWWWDGDGGGGYGDGDGVDEVGAEDVREFCAV